LKEPSLAWEWDERKKEETRRVKFTSDTKKGKNSLVKKRKPKKSKKKKEQEVMDLEEARRR